MALVALITLTGFGLRVYRLDGQSLWSDEGASAVMAGRDLAQIAAAAAHDIHPPLYYAALAAWSKPAGTSEFSLRFLSVICGTLLLPLTYALGRRLLGPWPAVLGTALGAIAPFQIYYAQEARMYMPMALLAALSVWLALRVWDGPDPLTPFSRRSREKGPRVRSVLGLAFAWVLATTALLYTQYFAATVVLFEALAFALLFWRVRRTWRGWLLWGGLNLAVFLLYLPWLRETFVQISGWPSISESFTLPQLAQRVFLIFSFGLSWDNTATGRMVMFFAALAFAGLGYGLWRGRRDGAAGFLLLLGYLLVPILAMYLLSLRKPLYNPKFLLLAAPAFALQLGAGIAGLAGVVGKGAQWILARTSLGAAPRGRPPGSAGGAGKGPAVPAGTGAGRDLEARTPNAEPGNAAIPTAVAALTALALLAGVAFGVSRSAAAYYFDPKYQRDDYRGLARLIAAGAAPGDAIILNAPGQAEIFGYYYRGDVPVFPLPGQRPLDKSRTTADLERILADHRRVWLVLWAVQESDPEQFIEGWLNAHAFKSQDRWFGTVRLAIYSAPRAAGGAPDHTTAFRFADRIVLTGYSLRGSDGALAVVAGDVLQLTLYWTATAPPAESYKVFTHLLDPHEHLWGQRDAEPGSGRRPTTTWAPGERITDQSGLPVLAGTPPGEYQVEIGMYRPADGARVPVFDADGRPLGDRVLLGPVRVVKPAVPPALAALPIEHPKEARFGALRLLGYELFRLGAAPGAVDFRPGAVAHLGLYWQAAEKPPGGLRVRLQVLDAAGRVVLEQEAAPADGAYPTERWEAGEVVFDQHKLALGIAPGAYRLALSVTGAPGAAPLELDRLVVR